YFFTDRATTQFYTLSLHDALPICHGPVWKVPRESVRLPVLAVSLVVGAALPPGHGPPVPGAAQVVLGRVDGQRLVVDQVRAVPRDRKSTRLNSSHVKISYAVFCLK